MQSTNIWNETEYLVIAIQVIKEMNRTVGGKIVTYLKEGFYTSLDKEEA